MNKIQDKDIIQIIERTLNLVDPRLFHHARNVCYLTYSTLKHMECYDNETIKTISLLALLHDIGAYKTEEIDDMVVFEMENVWQHSLYGCLFIETFSPIKNYKDVILFHHFPYEQFNSVEPPLSEDHFSNLIHLCDRAELLHKTHTVEEVIEKLNGFRNTRFSSFWLDAFIKTIEDKNCIEKLKNNDTLKEYEEFLQYISFTNQEQEDYLSMISYAIDFRSEYMVLHTAYTVGISIALAKLHQLNESQLENIRIGSLLHDIGKIAIPVSILENPGRISFDEMRIMKTHVLFTEQIIKDILPQNIVNIAIRHHERMDGLGYPYGLQENQLSLEEKIVAVSDVISALLRKRSYKDAFSKEKTISLLQDMKKDHLSANIVDMAILHFDEIYQQCEELSSSIILQYDQLKENYKESLLYIANNERKSW